MSGTRSCSVTKVVPCNKLEQFQFSHVKKMSKFIRHILIYFNWRNIRTHLAIGWFPLKKKGLVHEMNFWQAFLIRSFLTCAYGWRDGVHGDCRPFQQRRLRVGVSLLYFCSLYSLSRGRIFKLLRAGTTILFLHGCYPPQIVSKFQHCTRRTKGLKVKLKKNAFKTLGNDCCQKSSFP